LPFDATRSQEALAMRKIVKFVMIAVALATAGRIAAAHAADGVSFAGKTVTMTIGNAAGGGTDVYGRVLGKYLVNHLPGKPTLVVINQPGAGGVTSLNLWVVRAPTDGTAITIGAQSQTDPATLIETQAKYDPRDLTYIGGIGSHSQALFLEKSAVARLADRSAEPVITGIVGSVPRSGMYQAFWGAAFLGWNIRWVHGYGQSAELRQALERGEVDMTAFGSVADIEHLVSTGKFTVVAQTGAVKGGKREHLTMLGDTPVMAELMAGKIKDPLAQKAFVYWDDVTQIGSWLALPPKVPEAIVTAYVKAFNDTINDPEYRAVADQIAPDSPDVSRSELIALVDRLTGVSHGTLDYLQDELKRQRF
jgi:tripartite-type tricarboxylate transporter receptor subunit TctC